MKNILEHLIQDTNIVEDINKLIRSIEMNDDNRNICNAVFQAVSDMANEEMDTKLHGWVIMPSDGTSNKKRKLRKP